MLGLGLQILSGLFSANTLKKLSFDGLLSGAWFHKKAPTYEVVDETPDVDTSRTWHKARALQFTGAEHIDIPLQLHYAQSTWKVEFEFIFEEHTSRQYIFDARISPSVGAAMSIRAAGNIPDLLVYNGSSYASVALSEGLVSGVRYKGYAEYDGTKNKLFIEGITDTPQEGSSFTQVDSNTTFRIGAYIGGGSNFIGSIGWMRITQDNIVTAEYAFEEGEGTICYNRVMNNFHGTINNATISTFRVEDVRITNGDQGTFLNTEGYRDNNKIYSSTDYFWQGAGCTVEADLSFQGKEGVKKVTFPAGTYSNATLQAFHNNALLNLRTTSTADDHTLTYYFPSGQQNNWFRLTSGDSIFQAVEDTWTTVSFSMSTNDARVFMIDGDGDSNLDITTTQDVVFYIGDYVVTEPNVYVPRPRVTDIPLYNAGKYAYYIPDHTNNYIDLNTAFAGLTNPGDWMEFGIATVGTGEPTGQLSWAVSIDGSDSSSFYLGITNADTRFYSSSGRVQVTDANAVNEDFYSFRITKDQNVTSSLIGIGTIEIFDRDGNLITSYPLTSGPSGNEGTYIYDRFFPSAYGTDFILAYLKLSDGTVWNGANDFNGGVNIANSGTGNVTKIFFESVDEDVLGNPLTYKGQVAQPLSLVNSNGAYFSGEPFRVDFSQIDVSDFTMTFYAYLDSSLAGSNTNRELFSDNNTSQGLLFFSDQRLYYYAGGHNGVYNFSSHIPDEEVVNKWQKFSIIRNDSANTLSFVVENDSRTVTTDPAQSGAIAPYDMIGKKYTGGNLALGGSLAWVSLHSKAMTIEEARAIDPYNMDTDSLEIFLVPSAGHGPTVYDLSGNNNHGTITNATLSNFWIKQDKFHWNLKKGFDYYTRFADDVNQVQYNEELSALHQDQTYTIRTQFYFAGFPYPDTLNRVESMLFSAKINSTQRFAIWIEGNNSNATFNVGYYDGSNYHTVLLLNPMKPGPYYLEIVKDSPGYDFTSITLNGDSIDVSQAGASFVTIIYQTGIGCRAVDATADRRWYGGVKFFEIVGEHYLSEDNGFVDTIGNLTLDVANTNISTQKDRIPYAPPGRTLSNPAGKWHNDAETEINFPHTAKLHMINEQFNYKPFFYKNAQLDDATAAYSMRKVIADYEGPLLNVIRSSDLQAQDFYPDSRGDLDTAAITSFVNDASPVLDDNSGAVSAYSLRKVRTEYTGSAIEVRRSSNGDTLNIGFNSNGDLDTTALLAFVNAEYTLADEDFSSSTGWTLGTGVSITGGVMTANTSGIVNAYKNFGDTGAQQVRVTFTISNYVSGIVRYMNFATVTLGTQRSANGTYTEILTLQEGGNANHGLQFSSFVGDIDDFEIVQITADGAVTTWYDQTENDPVNQKNATQSDPVKMPLVVSAGALVTEGGRPAMSLVDGQYFDNAGLFPYSRFDFFSVSKITDTLGMFLTFSTGGGKYSWVYGQGSTSTAIYSSFGTPTMYSNGVLQSISNRGDVYNAYNGHKIITTLGGDTSSWTDGKLFAYGGFGVTGTVQEIISYDTDQSSNRANIEANIGRYYSIDGFADGRVATWYDQANGNHATQTTPDSQPLIVNDGVLVTENSKPAIDFDGVDDYLATPSIAHGTNDISIIGVFVNELTTGDQSFVSSQHASGMQWSRVRNDEFFPFLNNGTSSFQITNSSFTANQQYLYSSIYEADWEIFANGTSLGTDTIGTHADIGSGIYAIGALYNNTDFLQGKVQELTLFNSDQSSNRQDIEKNIADYYDITLSGNAGVESWVKNVSFADMYQIWYDYEYLHRLFANFEIPNKVFKVLAYTSELTADQRQQVYDYLQKNYHPIYTPYSTRVLADGGTLAAGQTNTLTIIDSI